MSSKKEGLCLHCLNFSPCFMRLLYVLNIQKKRKKKNMKVKVIIAPTLLLAFAAMPHMVMGMGENKDQLSPVSTTTNAMLCGSPDAKPYEYVNAKTLLAHPLVQKHLGIEPIEYTEETLTLPQDMMQKLITSAMDQKKSVEQNPNATQEEKQEVAELDSIISSVIIHAPASDLPASGFTWAQRWYLTYYGDQATLTSMIDNKEFNPNNTDHMTLLSKCSSECMDKHDALNKEYQQKFETLKTEHLRTMVAKITVLQEFVKKTNDEITEFVSAQQAQKTTLLQQHDEQYTENNKIFEKFIRQELGFGSPLTQSIPLYKSVEQFDLTHDITTNHMAEVLKDMHKACGEVNSILAIADKK